MNEWQTIAVYVLSVLIWLIKILYYGFIACGVLILVIYIVYEVTGVDLVKATIGDDD